MNENKLAPYDYQAECISALTNHFESGNDRALVVMATGLGKTLTMAFYLDLWFQAADGRVLFLLDQGDPLFQAHKEFEKVMGATSVTFGFWTGVEKSVKPEKCNVLFSTFQCMRLHLERFGPKAFDLVIVDEAHHSQADYYREVIEYFVTAQRIGMTATPDRGDGKNILELFGALVYEFTLARALAECRLSKVEYLLQTDNIDLDKLQELVKKVREGDRSVYRRDIDETIFIPERMERIAEKVRSVQNGTKKTIIFCKSLQHLNEVRKSFPHAKPYHSEVTKVEREEIYEAFRSGELREVLVIDMFNEAIDIPSAEVLVFLRSTNSKRILLQQLGRGLRGVHKTVTVLDYVANVERINTVSDLNWDTAQGTDGGDDGGPDLKPGLQIHGSLNINFSEEIIDLLKVLSWISKDLYPTYSQAKAAVQQLVPIPKNVAQYRDVYQKDPCLPGAPNLSYAEVWGEEGGWYGFLGRAQPAQWYSYDEAKAAVRNLNPIPEGSQEYSTVYKQDPHLPSNPDKVYTDVWKKEGGWPGFLNRKLYSYEEAQSALQRLTPHPAGGDDYRRVYSSDPRLPYNPDRCYKNVWKEKGGWYGFLGTKKS